MILTASNETQAAAYREQIQERLEKDLLPRKTHYAVLPDPNWAKVGSGGTTFQVLRYLGEQNPDEQELHSLIDNELTYLINLIFFLQKWIYRFYSFV